MTRARSTWSLLALLSALVLPATALGQQRQQGDQQANQQQEADPQQNGETAQEEGQQEDAAEASQPKQLKIFQLENITPREFSELFRRYGSQTLTGAQTGAYPGSEAYASGGGATAPPAPATEAQGATREQVRIAVDDEKGLLFVRGPQKKIDEVSKLIEAFDVAPGEMQKQQFGDTHLIPIPEEHAQRVAKVLRELQMSSSVWGVGKARVLIFRADSENEEAQQQMEQAQEIISRLTEDAEQEASEGDDAEGDDAEEESDDDAEQDEDVEA